MVRKIEERFGRTFAHCGIALPPEHVRDRRRGKIVGGGWAIWFLFGEDERGEYLDYYASHRMTDDRHVRLREGSPAEHLPAIRTFLIRSRDPGEGARLRPPVCCPAGPEGPTRRVGGAVEIGRTKREVPRKRKTSTARAYA